ncbi:Fc.00g043430.m01.CDS01 [Cosmosporella sp. VM-42]
MENGPGGNLSRVVSRPSSPNSSEKNGDLFFSRLPFEIRRNIQLLAFGSRTLHMDLEFRYPLHQVNDRSSIGTVHAGILRRSEDYTPDPNDLEEEQWRWFGCVCHRYPYDRPNLPLGRKRGYPYKHFIEPDVDYCLEGMGKCREYPGEWPEKCKIGIMGWLQSRRNAYIEGMFILYSTNTIHIASPTLIRSIQDIIPRQRLANLTSLELLWDPEQLPLSLGFTSDSKSNRQDQLDGSRPIFPSLLYLRICFKRLTYGRVDHATDLVWPYPRLELADRLHNRLLPTVDCLLERIVPPSTDVTLSCAKWDWYELIDLHLVEKQGKERTKPQRADIEGLKCWREVPRTTSGLSIGIGATTSTLPSSAAIEEAQPKNLREGYWIHMCIEDVHLESGNMSCITSETIDIDTVETGAVAKSCDKSRRPRINFADR